VRALAKLEQVSARPPPLDACSRCTTNVASLQWSDGARRRRRRARRARARVSRPRAGAVRLPQTRRRRLQPAGRAAPARVDRRRWYLVAWDVRRDDWRTFRLDRLERARSPWRCAPRELPGGDAAAFVASRSARCPSPLGVLESQARRRRARPLHWGGADVEALDASRSRCGSSGASEQLVRVVTGSRPYRSRWSTRSVATLVDDLVARLALTNTGGSVRESAAVGEDGVGEGTGRRTRAITIRRRVLAAGPGSWGRAAPEGTERLLQRVIREEPPDSGSPMSRTT
jgi:hypothetical protein